MISRRNILKSLLSMRTTGKNKKSRETYLVVKYLTMMIKTRKKMEMKLALILALTAITGNSTS